MKGSGLKGDGLGGSKWVLYLLSYSDETCLTGMGGTRRWEVCERCDRDEEGGDGRRRTLYTLGGDQCVAGRGGWIMGSQSCGCHALKRALELASME